MLTPMFVVQHTLCLDWPLHIHVYIHFELRSSTDVFDNNIFKASMLTTYRILKRTLICDVYNAIHNHDNRTCIWGKHIFKVRQICNCSNLYY